MLDSPHAIVVSDLHLNTEPREETWAALDALLARHPRAELILNGDVFELSAFPASEPAELAFERILGCHPRVGTALCEHLARGAEVTFVVGNHDAALTGISDAVYRAFRHGDRGARVAPWFVRRNGVHVEHGHVYDPDNAPLHPLADFDAACEPLGAALMRRFIVRSGAKQFAHAHDTTPVQGILRAFRLYGPRAPAMIASYFREAFKLCFEAFAGRPSERELSFVDGRARMATVAAEAGLSLEALDALWSVIPVPTHARFWSLFRRLYFDAILAGFAGGGAVGRLLLSQGGVGALLALLASGGYLLGQSPRGRYAGRPCQELNLGAHEVARITGASRVVFGHTHVEEDDGPYLNPGSFTYARGPRGYAILYGDSQAAIGRL